MVQCVYSTLSLPDTHLELCQGVRVRRELQGVKGAARVQPVEAIDAGAGALCAVGLCSAHQDDLHHGRWLSGPLFIP